MAADDTRNPSAVSPGRRCEEIRRLAYSEGHEGAHEAHTVYEAAALPNSAAGAAWGPAFRTAGFDLITALLHMTKGAGTLTQVNVLVQVSWAKNPSNPEWYDLYEDEVGDGAMVLKQYEIPIAVAEGRAAFVIPVRGTNMRVKLWGTSADGDSRAALRVIRDQAAWGN